MPNPYLVTPANQMDPQREGRRGMLSDIFAGANPHSRGQRTGTARRQYAQQYNQGALPWQQAQTKNAQDYENQQYERNRQQKLDATQGLSQDMKDYIYRVKAGEAKGEDGKVLSFRDYNQQVTKSNETKGAGRKAWELEQEVGQKFGFDSDQYKRVRNINRALKVGQQSGAYGTVDDQGLDTFGDGPDLASDIDQANIDAANKAAGISTAQAEAGYNVDFQAKLHSNAASLEESIPRLMRLRKTVEDGPATGQLNQFATMFNSEMQALRGAFLGEAWNKVIDMKDQGMAFGNFTDSEFVRIIQTLSDMGNTKEANLAILDRVLKEMNIAYGMFGDRIDDPEAFMSPKRWKRKTFTADSVGADAHAERMKTLVGDPND